MFWVQRINEIFIDSVFARHTFAEFVDLVKPFRRAFILIEWALNSKNHSSFFFGVLRLSFSSSYNWVLLLSFWFDFAFNYIAGFQSTEYFFQQIELVFCCIIVCWVILFITVFFLLLSVTFTRKPHRSKILLHKCHHINREHQKNGFQSAFKSNIWNMCVRIECEQKKIRKIHLVLVY